MIALYVGFLALLFIGGLIWYSGSQVVDAMSTIVQSEFPGSWTGADGLFLGFVTNWWVYLGLFMLLGGTWWLIVNTQRERERAR